MEKEKIHITVCLDKGFVMPTGVMMYSVCVNNIDVDIDFHILIDESVTEKDQQDLKDTIYNYHGKRIIFYSVKNNSVLSFPLNRADLTRASYYRLFLSDILPSTINKVLYLDGDIIVRHSLMPLWHTDLNSYAVGAAIDVDEGLRNRYNRLQYPFEKGYFNAGVLLINLKYWRDNNIVKEFVEYLNNYPERIDNEDQDVMNVVLQDIKQSIHVKYNFQTGFLRKVRGWNYCEHESEVNIGMQDPVIVHFSERRKPWRTDLRYPHPYKNTFLKYQGQTKWKNCCYDPRPLNKKIRNMIGDFLRIIGLKEKKINPFIDIPPID